MDNSIERIPFGIAPLDIAASGGFLKGKVNLWYGPPKSGKTNLAYSAIAQLQKIEGEKLTYCFNGEDKDDEEFARGIGVVWERIEEAPPEYLEVHLNTVLDVARNIDNKWDNIHCIFIDGMKNMPANIRLEKSIGDMDYGIESQIWNKFYAQLPMLLAKRRIAGFPLTILVTNHQGEGHSTVPGMPNPIIIPRGKQQLYAAHMRVRLKNPKYVGEKTLNGFKVPFALEVKFIVESNLGSISKVEGEYRLFQVGTEFNKPGTCDELDFLYKIGISTGYITKAHIIGEDFKFANKAELFSLWNRDKILYWKHRDAIVQLGVELFKLGSRNIKEGEINNEE